MHNFMPGSILNQKAGLDTNTYLFTSGGKIGLVESEKWQLTKNTCPIRNKKLFSTVWKVVFWCSNRLVEN